MIEALFFEIENVLVDTRAARRDARAAALAPLGGAEPRDETDRELTALRLERALDDALSGPVVTIPGACDALAALAQRVRTVAVTRLPRRAAASLLARAALDDLVTAVIGDAPLDHAAFERALAHVARVRPTIDRHRVVALVDTAEGAAAARAAGMLAVRVGDAAPHDADGATAWVASVADLSYDALVALLTPST